MEIDSTAKLLIKVVLSLPSFKFNVSSISSVSETLLFQVLSASFGTLVFETKEDRKFSVKSRKTFFTHNQKGLNVYFIKCGQKKFSKIKGT